MIPHMGTWVATDWNWLVILAGACLFESVIVTIRRKGR